jgi:hypothetical protein
MKNTHTMFKTPRKTGYLRLLVLVLTVISLSLGITTRSSAQCGYDNYQYGNSVAPTSCGVLTTLATDQWAGEFRRVTGLVVGSSYTFAVCGASYDSQLTLYPVGGGSSLAYDDDGCGVASTITWTATMTSVDVLLDQYYCTSNTTNTTMTLIRNNGCVVTPVYCTTGLTTYGCQYGDYIDNFSLSNLSQTATGCPSVAIGYSDYTASTINLVQGNTYTWTASFGYSSQYLKIWIDLNNDGDFDDVGELMTTSTSGQTSGNFTLSASAAPGNHRLSSCFSLQS